MLDSRFLDRLLTRVVGSVCVPVLRKMWSVKTAKKSQFRQRPTEGRNGKFFHSVGPWVGCFGVSPSWSRRSHSAFVLLGVCSIKSIWNSMVISVNIYHDELKMCAQRRRSWDFRSSTSSSTVRFQAGARIVVSVSCRFARRRWLQLHWLASWMQHHVLRWWKNISKYFSTIFNTWNLLKNMFCKAKRLF